MFILNLIIVYKEEFYRRTLKGVRGAMIWDVQPLWDHSRTLWELLLLFKSYM